MNVHRLKELGILNSDIIVPEKSMPAVPVVPAVPVENTTEQLYQYTCEVGDQVRYNGNNYVIIDYWFDCGGMVKIINIVRINTGDSRGPFVLSKSLADGKINECELIRRGVA